MSTKDEEWTMLDGKKIMVNDMSESHAKNCLRLLIRRINEHNSISREEAFDEYMDRVKQEIYMADAGDR